METFKLTTKQALARIENDEALEYVIVWSAGTYDGVDCLPMPAADKLRAKGIAKFEPMIAHSIKCAIADRKGYKVFQRGWRIAKCQHDLGYPHQCR